MPCMADAESFDNQPNTHYVDRHVWDVDALYQNSIIFFTHGAGANAGGGLQSFRVLF